MAKKTAGNKSQAVRDYLNSDPAARPAEVVAALKEQGIVVLPGLVRNVKSKLSKAGKAKKAAKAHVLAEAAVPAAIEKPAKSNGTISLEQIKKVAQTIQALGGFGRMTEVLEVIKEVGGLKKFRDLAEAMSCPASDDIPF